MRLAGRRALVTGSSRGIGAEIAKLFASEGATVVVNYRASGRDADSVVRGIRRRGGTSFSVAADVSDPIGVKAMFSELKSRLGGLDILVNCAGLSDSRIWNATLPEITLDMWRSVLAVDAYGTFLCIQAASELMKKGGAVVNVASTPALAGDTEGIVFAAAKGAVAAMTKMLAKVLAPRVRVNCMVFGSFETTWVDWLTPAQVVSYTKAIPMGRFGKPQEAAKLALFLASDESSFITGQTIIADGGEVMR